MVTFEFALDTIMSLDKNEQEDIIEIIQKRRSQEWRQETADYYRKYKKYIVDKSINPVSVEEAIDDLHKYLQNNI